MRWAWLFFVACVGCSSGGESAAPADAATDVPLDTDSGWIVPDGGDVACTKLDAAACNECCWARRPTARTFVWDLVRKCVCNLPTPLCQDECGPLYCNGALGYEDSLKSNPKCEPCLDDHTPDDCLKKVADSCTADKECTTALDCLDLCPPDPPDAGSD